MSCADGIAGIDFSHYQGDTIPLDEAAELGIAFGICKIAHGLSEESTFASHWRQLEAPRVVQLVDETGAPVETSMRRGGYTWWVPQLDPITQADRVVSIVGRLPDDAMPITVDVEQKTALPPLELLARLRAYRRALEAATNRPMVIYTGRWWWVQYLDDLDAPDLAELPLHHAQYPSTRRHGTAYSEALAAICAMSPALPRPWGSRAIRETIWQFDGDGGLLLPNGVDVDVNRFAGSLEALGAFCARRLAPTTDPQSPAARRAAHVTPGLAVDPVEQIDPLDFVRSLATDDNKPKS